MGHHQLDTLDEQILKLIAGNARIPFLEVARACNVSGAAIHQRIQKLTNLGILKGSEYVIDPEKVGYETCAYIGIYLKDPESFDSVTKALEAIPEVVECHFTTGKYDMFIKIYAKNNHHLLSIIHDKLQPLGLARTETLISFHEAIKRQMPIMVRTEGRSTFLRNRQKHRSRDVSHPQDEHLCFFLAISQEKLLENRHQLPGRYCLFLSSRVHPQEEALADKCLPRRLYIHVRFPDNFAGRPRVKEKLQRRDIQLPDSKTVLRFYGWVMHLSEEIRKSCGPL